ncbi:kunitz-type serine protease inhibitor PPTI [Drosophila innubila]|uniref:kunitz-type serine protease inhibitor PPTI n=1 Tax=Drosophila innubila TaxID=198719 RepID=UPI00148CC07F|nr:kunitz-type serine protease inhibitor PPTI [Drosophila innubila]
MQRSFILILILLLISFICIVPMRLEEWDENELRWKFIYKAVCQKRPKYGKCKGHREMWYFDMSRMKCNQFTYSNCGGNTNRFFTKTECDEFCTSRSKDWMKRKQ